MQAHWLSRCPKSNYTTLIILHPWHGTYGTPKNATVLSSFSRCHVEVGGGTWITVSICLHPVLSHLMLLQSTFYPDTFLWLAPKNQELTSMTNNKGLYIIPNLAFYKMLNNPPPNRGHWTSPSKMHPSLISMWCLFFLKVHRKSLAFTSKVRDSRVITIQKSDPGALCKASKTCASCPSCGAILPIL